ncbi:MAG: phage tail protein [bacterium]|nr:phage tail protein [bacterium]
MDQPYIGSIVLFAGNFAPRGWALCWGQLLPIAQNAALFSILGTTYGGNGVQTFALPDLRGRVPIQQGQAPGLSAYVLGEASGTETTTLLTPNLPQHNHLLMGNQQASGNEFPGPAHVIGASTADKMYTNQAPNVNMAPTSISMTGGNQPFSNMQPYLALNFIIALQGIFPSRN